MKKYALKLIVTIFISMAAAMLFSCSGGSSVTGSGGLSGIVVDDPVAGATVTVYGENGIVLAKCRTNAVGRYSAAVDSMLARRVVVTGGTINGNAFTGSMEGICDGSATCNITPLTTVAAWLVDEYSISSSQAWEEVQQTLGVNEGEDPFILDFEGQADENDLVRLASMREKIGEAGENLDAWISNILAIIPPPYEGILRGTADIAGPLKNADINVVYDDYDISPGNTDSDGVWKTSAPVILNDDFRVEAYNGSIWSGFEFEGTLSAYIPYEGNSDFTGDQIRLTVLSTIIDRYMQFSERSYEDAVDRVQNFLNIPDEMGINDEMIGAWFSDIAFMERVEEKGGFDAYIDEIALGVDFGEKISIGGPTNSFQIVDATFGEKLFNGIVGGGSGAIVGFALGKAIELIGPSVGYYTPEQITNQRLAEIKATLDEMNGKLDTIDGKLSDLAKSLNMTKDEIISQVYISSVKSAAGRINGILEEYLLALSRGTNSLAGFFDDYTSRQIKNDLSEINTGLFSKTYASGNGLTYLTSSLEEKIKNAAFGEEKNRVLDQAYQSIDIIFTEAMADQIKGVILLRSKLDYESGGNQTESDAFLEGILTPRFKEQTELFLSCVERLVAASADCRTLVQGGGNMFPSCVKRIFEGADLQAGYFHPDHKGSFFVRVAGDPKSISQFSESPKGKNWGTPTPISATDYSAPLPDGASFYLGWMLDRNTRWHFSRETKIRILKLRFSSMEKNMSVRKETCVYPYNRVVQVSVQKKEIDSGSFYYANTFVTARAVPEFNFKRENRLNSYKGVQIPHEHTADRKSALLRAFYGQGVDIPWDRMYFEIDTQADMFLEIINDTSSSVKLRLRGAVNELIINDTGGKTTDTRQELHWQVKVGGTNMFSREYEYDLFAWPWSQLKTEHKHTHVSKNGGTAEWKGGGTLDVMRQVYFRASRAKSYMNHIDSLQHVDTIFETSLKCLEIMPEGWPTDWEWGY